MNMIFFFCVYVCAVVDLYIYARASFAKNFSLLIKKFNLKVLLEGS